MELLANTPTPGTAAAQTTLAAAITSTTATSITVTAAAAAALQTAGGQFRILIDTEIMLVTAGASGTTWTVVRAQEGSTAATHANGASVYHVWTAAGITALINGLLAAAVANVAFVIREASGVYPNRATGAPAAISTSTVFWIGVDAPTIGSPFAINDVDIWIPTSV